MSVNVTPWKETANKYMVTVRFRWPSGNVLRDRKVIDAKSAAQAKRWGEQRESGLRAKGETKHVEGVQAVDAPLPGITVSDWYKAYYDHAECGEVGRKNAGSPQASVGDRRDRFRVWIEPHIGHLPMSEVASEHLRWIVNMLDDCIRRRIRWYETGSDDNDREERHGKKYKPGISSKTASHVWSEITGGFREALSSKIDELRVLKSDPTFAVQPPIRTKPREMDALYPSEVVKLLSCELIPVERRQLYAVGLYTALRRSELERLMDTDVNFEHDTITVRGTKTDAANRQVPIEPALRPLMVKLCKLRKGGTLLAVPSHQGTNGTADLFRQDLQRAGVDRAELFYDDMKRMPINFHGLRHSCITAWAVAGKNQLFLLTVAGHLDVQMTKRYLGKAASISKKYGKPFPPIPPRILGGGEVVALRPAKTA